MLTVKSLGLVLAAALSAHARPQCGCAADECFAKASLPAEYLPTASSFCLSYLSTTAATATKTITTFITDTTTLVQTTTPGADPATVTDVITTSVTDLATVPFTELVTTVVTVTATAGTVCTVTSTTSLPTVVNYRVRGQGPTQKRSISPNVVPEIPLELSKGCKPKSLPAKLSAACSCFLETATITVTATETGIATASATETASTAPPVSITSVQTETVTNIETSTISSTQTDTVTVTAQPCTSTVTSYSYAGQLSCGIPTPTAIGSGSVTCAQDNVQVYQTNAPFRIEGGSEGTIWDGCVISEPKNITTPSGGTHLCDGTNNNANPAPGATFTTDIDSAGQLAGFDFDGTFSNQFQDFFITRISQTAQTGSQFWGVLRNRVFTARGGCQEQTFPQDEALWAFDAFAPNRVFLSVEPQYQVVKAGETASITVNVQAGNPNSGNTIPAQGSTFGQNAIADANGNLQVMVPSQPGCYQFKAEMTNAVRSNAFYLTVLPAEN